MWDNGGRNTKLDKVTFIVMWLLAQILDLMLQFSGALTVFV